MSSNLIVSKEQLSKFCRSVIQTTHSIPQNKKSQCLAIIESTLAQLQKTYGILEQAEIFTALQKEIGKVQNNSLTSNLKEIIQFYYDTYEAKQNFIIFIVHMLNLQGKFNTNKFQIACCEQIMNLNAELVLQNQNDICSIEIAQLILAQIRQADIISGFQTNFKRMCQILNLDQDLTGIYMKKLDQIMQAKQEQLSKFDFNSYASSIPEEIKEITLNFFQQYNEYLDFCQNLQIQNKQQYLALCYSNRQALLQSDEYNIQLVSVTDYSN